MSFKDILYHPVSGKTNNLVLFVTALVLATVLFPFPAAVFANGIDPPLAWVFNFLVIGNFSLGKDIVFPHGPLAFLMYPLPFGPNIWIAVSVHLTVRIFLGYSLLKLATRKPLSHLFLALVSSFVVLAVNDLLLTIIQVVILCYLNFFEGRNIWWLIPALIITPIALYIKAFVGIVSLMVTLAFAGLMIYRSIIGYESWYRLLLFLIVPFVLLALWFGFYGNLQGISGYLKGMAELAGDNSAAAAVYPDNNWWVIGLALISGLGLVSWNVKNVACARFAILAGPALFAIWKYGMARQDYLHASMLFVFLLFIILIFNIISGKFKIINIAFSVLIVTLFYITLQKSYYFEPFQLHASGVQNLAAKSFNNKYFSDTCNASSEKVIARNKLDKRILDIVGSKPADIYPWDYTFIAANRLNWQPRPVIQSYASYTRNLDQLNASHLQGDRAPDFIIWEMRKITHDLHGGTLESIDGRYLLNDEPATLLTMLRNYEPVAFQGGLFPVFVFKKRDIELTSFSKVIRQTHAGWNTWIDVPGNSTGLLQASADIQRNFTGKLKSFFYKDEATFIYYLLENGDIRIYRIVPKNAAYGLWINPLIMNPENGEAAPAVSKIMFRCSNKEMMKDDISIKWEEVSFFQNKSKPVKDVAKTFFRITRESAPEENLKSENTLEEASIYWSEPEKSSLLINGLNHSFLLQPGAYSVSFQYPLDSLLLKDSVSGFIVRTGVWAKAIPGAVSVFVISIEKEGKSLSWKAVDIQNFIHDNNSMNFVTNFSELEKEILQQDGLTIKVYAWNTGKEPIELDDFSVRIETR